MKLIDTFYRLTQQEKDALVEQCRKRIEDEKIKETETVRKILEELLALKWDMKKKNAEKEREELLVLLDDLLWQIDNVQGRLAASENAVGSLREKLASSERNVSSLRGQLTMSEGVVSNLQAQLSASENMVSILQEKLDEKTVEIVPPKSIQIELRDNGEDNKLVYVVAAFCVLMMVLLVLFAIFF